MKINSQASLVLAILSLCSVLAGVAHLTAQDNAIRQKNSVAPSFPASARNAPGPSSTTTESSSASSGWLQFDKCPVFALESVDIPAQESGVIASIQVDENDTVNANQLLGKLEVKVAELEKGVAGLQAQVASSEAIDESEIRLAEAIVEESQLQVEVFEVTTAKGSTGESELRQKQLTLTQAKVRLTQAKANKQQKELKSKLAQASLFLSQQKLDRLMLRSPITGTVTRIEHRPGEWVGAGTTILKLIRLDQLRVDCLVDIDLIDPAKIIDQRVKVLSTRGSLESQFAGKIDSYDPDVSSSGKIRVRAVIQNQKSSGHWVLLPGMSVRMQIAKPL
ncbi:MAG: HlyD family efflux transporter periplasmic adaptor subunit [Pirellula sp.]